MIINETKLNSAFVIDIERLEDERGFFSRCWCEREFSINNINSKWVQANISFNKHKGTLRGMHYQAFPHEEDKLIRCTKGAIYDVIIDIRKKSATYKHWLGVELSEDNRRLIYVPKGFAHGFITLRDNSEVFYLMSEFYQPGFSRGIRWNDPAIRIKWPRKITVLSSQDKSYPDVDF